MTKQPKPWRRAERIAEQCKAGKTLCREPGGRQVGTRSAENAIRHGLLIPQADGLFGPDSSQTWIAP